MSSISTVMEVIHTSLPLPPSTQDGGKCSDIKDHPL
jgi:hypothetical protein